MNTLKRFSKILLVLGLLAPGLAAAADFVVIVNPANKTGSLSKGDLQRFFLRNATSWSSGDPCKPVDLPKASPVRVAFSKDVLGRNMAALDQFWTHSVFSGRAVPPSERKSEREVLEFVRENQGAIGYVSAGAALEGVKKINVTD
jgi:ABC-type phosphate transport system substrate-binding protein